MIRHKLIVFFILNMTTSFLLPLMAGEAQVEGFPALVVQLGHSQTPCAAALSSDGRYLATTGYDKTLVLWEVSSGKQIRKLDTGQACLSVHFLSSDASKVVTAGLSQLSLWDLAEGKEMPFVKGEEHSSDQTVGGVSAMTKDRQFLAIGYLGGRVDLWDLVKRAKVRTFSMQEAEEDKLVMNPTAIMQITQDIVRSLAFSNDGKLLVAANMFGQTVVWKIDDGRQINRFSCDTMHTAAFSGDDRQVLLGTASFITGYDWKTGEKIIEWPVQVPTGIIFSHDGQLVLYSKQSSIIICSTTDGKEVHKFDDFPQTVLPLCFSGDNKRFVVTDRLGAISMIDSETGAVIVRFSGAGLPVKEAKCEAGGRRISTSGSTEDLLDYLSAVANAKTLQPGLRWQSGWDTQTSKVSTSFVQSDNREDSNDGKRSLYSKTAPPLDRLAIQAINEITKFQIDTEKLAETRDLIGFLLSNFKNETTRKMLEKSSQCLDEGEFCEAYRLLFESCILLGKDNEKQTLDELYAQLNMEQTASMWKAITLAAREIGGNSALTSSSDDLKVAAAEENDIDFYNIELMFSSMLENARKNNGVINLADRLAAVGKAQVKLKGHSSRVVGLCFTPDNAQLLSLDAGGVLKLWTCSTAKESNTISIPAEILSPEIMKRIVMDDQKRFLAFADRNREVYLIDLKTGRLMMKFKDLGNDLENMSCLSVSGDNLVLLGTKEGKTVLFSLSEGRLICSLLSFRDGSWTVAAPDGRFDTNNLEDNQTMHWVMPDNPFKPLPLEAFMREYYEPRLLPRLLAGEKMPPVRPIMELNRIQPESRIVDVVLDPVETPRSVTLTSRPTGGSENLPPTEIDTRRVNGGLVQKSQIKDGTAAGKCTMGYGSGAPTGLRTVSVTVEVARAKKALQLGGKETFQETGAYDLRLFRDGQMVGQWPDPAAATKPLTSAESSLGENSRRLGNELQRWRKESELVLDPATGRTRVTFHGVRLPSQGKSDKVEFSAYCFNEDRVKSATTRRSFSLPPTGTKPVHRRAYIVCMGVNATQNPLWNLRFAANDARALSGALEKSLKSSGQFLPENVTSLTLVSERNSDGNEYKTDHARKDIFKSVLEVLSGKPDKKGILKGVPGAENLKEATPDDALLLAFAGHGSLDDRGVFYMVPSDTGESTSDMAALVRRSISSDELSLWLKDVDAGEMALIVDACHSAGALGGEGFKPGPMGSRGLGQLSYDKGIRVLAATQADDVALEIDRLGHGLLTYALVKDGLEERKAASTDQEGKGKEIYLSGWLQYAVRGVPELYKDIAAGRWPLAREVLKSKWSKASKASQPADNVLTAGMQQPSVFDFTKGKRDLLLLKDIQ